MKLVSIAISCVVVSACDSDFDNPVGNSSSYNSGDADFTKFVSIGDSLTAGYADAALYIAGQESSYPAILAQQFAQVGGGAFNQPLVNDNLGGLLFLGNPDPDFANRLVLDAETESPEPIAGSPTTEVFSLQAGPFNNVGVPGAKSFHLGAPGYGDGAGLGAGTANPYFVRFASSTTTTVIADAASQLPSFFVMWIGNNDVLSYATTGGTGVDQVANPDPTTYGFDDITSPVAFAGVYAQLVGAVTGANPAAKGVLVNIPDVSTIPFFTTVPHNPVPLDQANADALNAAYAAYNGGLLAAQSASLIDAAEVAQRTIIFAPGQNAVVIIDEDLTDITGVDPALIKLRQATAADLLVLTTSSTIGTLADPNNPASAIGLGVPLSDADVLIPSEIQAIDTARLAFNTTIKATADANPNLLFVDAAAILAELDLTGVDYGTGFINSEYATGGAFSLDGVHPTARGYALVANRIIAEINAGFNANIPPVDPGAYSTVFIK